MKKNNLILIIISVLMTSFSIAINFSLYKTIILLIALLIVIGLTIGIKEKNLTEKVYNIPQYVTTIFYLLLITALANSLIIKNKITKTTIFALVTVTVIYVFATFILKLVKHSTKEYDKKLKETGKFIKKASCIIEDLNKKELEDVLEEIKYSDPLSTEEVKETEEEIIKLLNEINDENISDKKNEVLKLVKKRNRIIKETK